MTMVRFPPGTFTPDPGAAAPARMVLAAARQELRTILRNGEQLLLAYLVPLAALVGMTLLSVGSLPEPRIASVAPGILALALMSVSFTSQAIVTGFDRRYGVTKRLAATGFPRWLLLAAKVSATTVIVVTQYILLILVAVLAFGWRPVGNPLWVALLTLMGIAAFIGLALLLGGTLRAEAVLGIANLVWLVLVGIGGIIIPLSSSPEWMQLVGEATPAGALTTGMRAVLTDGTGPGLGTIVILGAWIIIGWAGTMRWFRWQ